MSGYFFAGSKPGGLRIHPWIRRPSKLGYQISSGALVSISEKSASFTCVSCVKSDAAEAAWRERSRTKRSPIVVGVETRTTAFERFFEMDQDITSWSPCVTE